MEIYMETAPDVFQVWEGEPINGAQHPLSIHKLWSKTEIENAGLFVPEAGDPMPEGHRVVSDTVQRVAGVVKHVVVTEPIPEPTQEEIDAKNTAITDRMFDADQYIKVLLSVIFDMYDKNAAAGIAGYPVLTDQQKRNYVKNKL